MLMIDQAEVNNHKRNVGIFLGVSPEQRLWIPTWSFWHLKIKKKALLEISQCDVVTAHSYNGENAGYSDCDEAISILNAFVIN